MRIEAVFGWVPAAARDNVAELTPLVGAEKAAAIVKATGFATRRVATPGMTLAEAFEIPARAALEDVSPDGIGTVVTAAFSRERRFPALSATLQRTLGLPSSVASVDLSTACSGYPYALAVAEKFVSLTGRAALVCVGDLQSRFTDAHDPATLAVMGDAATATLVTPGGDAPRYAFHTDGAGAAALTCDRTISMDGFGVFRFVAGAVRKFLAEFLATLPTDPAPAFVAHQANMYMVRQLAEALHLASNLVTAGAEYGNPGGASVPLALAAHDVRGPAVLTGFGAGLSAAALYMRLGDYRRGVIVS